MIKIDKNIPHCRKANSKYPFDNMKIGDSFFLPVATEELKNTRRKTSVAIYSYSRLNNMKFSYRTVDGGIRVWRMPQEENI